MLKNPSERHFLNSSDEEEDMNENIQEHKTLDFLEYETERYNS
jgi:hypothetical protein